MNEPIAHRDRNAPDDEAVSQAMANAFRDAVRAHRLAGVPVVVSVNGEMQHVPADEIELPDDTDA